MNTLRKSHNNVSNSFTIADLDVSPHNGSRLLTRRYVFSFHAVNKILRLLFVSVVAATVSLGANAKEERTSRSLCATRVPQIEIDRAMKIAFDAIAKVKAVEIFYIDSVSLECKHKKQYWVVGFRRRAYESGHMLVYVHMDGTTEISVVKDG